MRANNGVLLAFALSFVITLMFWRRHHRMFDGLESFDAPLVALNGIWLFALVFLQFPTEVLGRVGGRGGIGTLYIGTLAVLTWLGVIIVIYLRRNPDLMPANAPSQSWPPSGPRSRRAIDSRGTGRTGRTNGALWMLLGLVVLGWESPSSAVVQVRRPRHNRTRSLHRLSSCPPPSTSSICGCVTARWSRWTA